MPGRSSLTAETCFASHGSLGVVDLGATKTVIGSNNVRELIESLLPEVQKTIYRCKCQVTFRFGNHGTLRSEHALVIPIHGFHLKIAVVQGSTPFLLSNTLLRALGAIIDTSKRELVASTINKVIPLHLTEKGLFLLDLNDLASVKAGQTVEGPIAETHNVVEPKETEATREEVSVTNESISVREKHPKSSCLGNRPISLGVDHHKAICQTATEEDQFDKPFAKSLSVPRRSPHHGVLDEASSWSVQTHVEENPPDVTQYSILELEKMKVDFGKKHLAATFQEVWSQDQPWIVWFVGHYPNSKKTSHVLFRHYVELMVERAELTEQKVPLVTPQTALPAIGGEIGKPYPKPKAQPKATRGSGSTTQTQGLMTAELLAEIETEEAGDQRLVRIHPGSSTCGEPACGSPGDTYAAHGECVDPSHPAPRVDEQQTEQPELIDRWRTFKSPLPVI